MLKIIIFLIFTINLSACVNPTVVNYRHPDLHIPLTPDLPKFSRDLINCGQDDSVLDLCIRIKQREETLRDHIQTIELLINSHNYTLGDEDSE